MNTGPYGLKPAPEVKDPHAVEYIEEIIALASSGLSAHDIANKLRNLIQVPPVVNLKNTPMEVIGYGNDAVYTLDIGKQSEQHKAEFGVFRGDRESSGSIDWVAELYIKRDEHDTRYSTPVHGTT